VTIGIDGRIVLEWIVRNVMGRCGLDSSDSGKGPVAALVKTIMRSFNRWGMS